MSLRRWVFERGILYAVDLTQNPRAILPSLSSTFGEIKPESSLVGLNTAMGLPGTRAISERLAGGRRCFAAFVEGRVVCYAWVSQRDECIGEQEREIRLGPREAYVWDCATIKGFRGQGLYSGLLKHILAVLFSEGIRRVWIGSSQDNRPSLKGFVNAGFKPVLSLMYGRFFGLRCLWAFGDPSAPKMLVAAARRALMTDQERARGPLIVRWSLAAALSPCADAEENLKTI